MNNFNFRKSLDFVFNAKLILFMFGMFLLLPNISIAAVNLPWSTTYNCPEWKQSDGLYPPAISCDGLTGYGGWTTTDGKEEQITSAANYPGGGSGRGQRHWLGDGSANNSGGTRIEFTSPQSELWIRWYMRFQQDFTWSSLQQFKILYINVGTSNSVILTPMQWDRMYVQTQCAPQNYTSANGYGWDSIIAANGVLDSSGHKKSDGQWHYYEVHLKVDTNGSNGIAEWWIDGIQVMSYNNVNFCGGQWTHFAIGSNHAYSANGTAAYYVDYDDFVVSTAGPIGGSIATSTPPVSDITSPSIPSNLSASPISTSQINLLWIASTDNIGVTGYRIYRCTGSGCTPTTQIATSATNSYSNTGLTANTTYVYRVAAYDAAGNISGQSSSASAATQAVADTTPPAAPTGLIVQ